MDWMRVVRQGDGLPMEEARVLLSSGWVCVPKVSLRHGSSKGFIAVPGSEPVVRVEVVDFWYLPCPAVPRGAVIAVLQEAASLDPELLVVDFLRKE